MPLLVHARICDVLRKDYLDVQPRFNRQTSISLVQFLYNVKSICSVHKLYIDTTARKSYLFQISVQTALISRISTPQAIKVWMMTCICMRLLAIKEKDIS